MAAATAAASRVAHAEEAGAVEPDVLSRAGAGVTWGKAPCRFCGTGCHVQVGVRDGRVVSIAGDRLAAVNQGLLCAKGYHVGLALYGRDRLTQPLLRRGGEQVPISWDEALDLVAEHVAEHPRGFAFYGSGQWTIPEGYAAQKLMKGGLGVNHIDPNARLCMASAVTGFISTYGVDEPACCYDDLDHADTIILWGNNPAEMHPVLFSRFIDRRSRGEQVELIDLATRRTRSTAFADRYIEFQPQGDMAIANGIMALLVERDATARQFVDRHCAFRHEVEGGNPLLGAALDAAEFRRRIAAYTPERVQELSGVAPADLRFLAERFGDRRRKIVSLWCMGVNQHTRGTAMNRLIHAVHLLSGHFGREGDGPQSLTGQPSACGTAREVGTLAHALPGGRVVNNAAHREQCEDLWNVPRGRIDAAPGMHTVAMWRSFSTPNDEEGGDIRTIWVQVTNPAQTLPNGNALVSPSRRHEGKFLIVSDVYPTVTTRAADLVLPSALWIEKNGMFGNSERRTQQWFKMVEPPGEARDDCWQTIAVARRLFDAGVEGMRDRDGRFLFHMANAQGQDVPIWDWAHYYDINVDEVLFEEYRQFSRLKHKDLAPYGEYVAARGLRWPVVERNGRWQETRYRFVGGEDPYVAAGRAFQFYHSTSEDDRAQIWFHDYVEPPERPDEEFPFWLCTGRVLEHWHTGSMTMRIPQLRRAMPNAYVEMHRADARRLRLANGDTVRVESRRGHVDLPVWIDGRGAPPRGTVFVPFFDERILVNNVTLDIFCPVSKQPDYKKCAVRIVARPPEIAT
jgi:nitrate reductase NapA